MSVKKSFKSVKEELEKRGMSLSRTTDRFTHQYSGYQVTKEVSRGVYKNVGSKEVTLQEIIDKYLL